MLTFTVGSSVTRLSSHETQRLRQQNQTKPHLNWSFLRGELTCGVTIACMQVLSATLSHKRGTKEKSLKLDSVSLSFTKNFVQKMRVYKIWRLLLTTWWGIWKVFYFLLKQWPLSNYTNKIFFFWKNNTEQLEKESETSNNLFNSGFKKENKNRYIKLKILKKNY